jgi:hypothetical protein
MDEGRKREIGIMAAILASLRMRTADDLFKGPQGAFFMGLVFCHAQFSFWLPALTVGV